MTKEIMSDGNNIEGGGQGQTLSNNKEGTFKVPYKELRSIFEAKPRDAALIIARKFLTLTDDFNSKASSYLNPEEAAKDVFVPEFSIKDKQSGPLSEEFKSEEFKQRLNYITTASRFMAAKSNIPNLSHALAGEFDEKINELLGIAENPERLMDRREFGKVATVTSLGFATAFLAACSGSTNAVAQVFSKETSAVTAPAPTVEPSKMPESSPTPDTRFSELVPDTLELCKKNNKIRLGHEAEDQALMLAKEKALNLNPNMIEGFSIGISDIDSKAYKTPSIIGINFSNPNKIPISSCSYSENENGKGMYRIGVPFKRTDSSNILYAHCAVDELTAELFFKQIGYPTEKVNSVNFNLTRNYEKIKTGDYKTMQVLLILWRGYAEQGGIWEDLLSLQPDLKLNTLKNNDYEFKITMFVGQRARDRNNNDVWVNIKDYGEEKLISELEKMTLPAVSIGVVY